MTWAVKFTCESKCSAIAEFSREAWRIDIAVAPTRIATIKTRNRALRSPMGISMSAAKQIRHGETALCNKAPHHRATPSATAL